MEDRQGHMRTSTSRIEELMKNKELKIVGWMGSEDSIMLLVSELNTANLKLEGTELEGRKVYIKKIIG